jgi:predicted phosphoribosyltransferase
MIFADRADAGRHLGARLLPFAAEQPVVVGLPRGGVAVAFEVAVALHAPLDVIVVRKLGVPFQPEFAMGAVGEDGARVVHDDAVRFAGLNEEEFAIVERRERAEVEQRAVRFRGGRLATSLEGKCVVVVDDGVATGSSARAACEVVRARGAAKVILAVPVGPWDIAERVGPAVDEIVCLEQPAGFFAVGEAYRSFAATSDEQVIDLLKRAAESV